MNHGHHTCSLWQEQGGGLGPCCKQKEIFPHHNWIKLPVLDPNERINHVEGTTLVDLLTFLTCIMGFLID